MEVKIGVQNVTREIVLESAQSADEVARAVADGLSGQSLDLTDDKGRRVLVPASAVAYVEIGAEESRRVGFGGVGGVV